jgi:hypothetical protein
MTHRNIFLILGKDKGLLATFIGSVFSATVIVALIITIGILIS